MRNLRAIKIIHDRKNRVLYNIISEFFRFIGVFVLEETVGTAPQPESTEELQDASADARQLDDTQFVIYLLDENPGDDFDWEPKPYYLLIVQEEAAKNHEIRKLTLQEAVLTDKMSQDLQKKIFLSIFSEMERSDMDLAKNITNDLLKVYLETAVVIAACDLQYYRIVSDIHRRSKRIFQNAIERINKMSRPHQEREYFRYAYCLLYCKQKVNLASWFLKDDQISSEVEDYQNGKSKKTDKENRLVYKIFDLIEDCQSVIRKYPQEANLYVLLAMMTERANNGYQIAVKAYLDALQLIGDQPYASHVFYWLGWLYENRGNNLADAKRAYVNAYLLKKKYRNTYKVAVLYEQEDSRERFFEYLKKCKQDLQYCAEIKMDPLEMEYYCKVCLLLCLRAWQYLGNADEAIQYGKELLSFYKDHIENDKYKEFSCFYGTDAPFFQRESLARIDLKKVHEVFTQIYRQKGDMKLSEEHRKNY